MVVVTVEREDHLLQVSQILRPEFKRHKLARFAERLFRAQLIQFQTNFSISDRWLSHGILLKLQLTLSPAPAQLPPRGSNRILLVWQVLSPRRKTCLSSYASVFQPVLLRWSSYCWDR